MINGPFFRIIRRATKIAGKGEEAGASPQDIFTAIYEKGRWGTGAGSFCSGPGSMPGPLTDGYVQLMTEYLRSLEGDAVVVDLGCGDMQVSRRLLGSCPNFVGVDVVPDLVKWNRRAFTGESVRFLCLDIVDEELPDGDICLLRQVLQHLSNDQIQKILPKLRKYRASFITEHLPTENEGIDPNLDLHPGWQIRLDRNSGVYLDRPPFELPDARVETEYEVRLGGLEVARDAGILRTVKLIFDG